MAELESTNLRMARTMGLPRHDITHLCAMDQCHVVWGTLGRLRFVGRPRLGAYFARNGWRNYWTNR